jgi:hypothetical protein
LVRDRQAAVAELTTKLNWRETLALLGSDIPEGADLEGLVQWGQATPVIFPPWVRMTAIVLPLLALLSLIAWFPLDLGPTALLIVAILEIALSLLLRAQTKLVLGPVEKRGHDLALLAGLLFSLEREPFRAPMLKRLQASLDAVGLPPSRRIAQLEHLIDWLNARRNQFFAPIAFLLLWHIRYAIQIEEWRQATGAAIGRWLKAVGEMEALSAFASYSFEKPEDPFPEILEIGSCFDGQGLGHPLIARSAFVVNDLCLGTTRLLMISGSNMSGKSTMLRTVGINVVLALAGGPVRARKLCLSPVTLGATLRFQGRAFSRNELPRPPARR